MTTKTRNPLLAAVAAATALLLAWGIALAPLAQAAADDRDGNGQSSTALKVTYISSAESKAAAENIAFSVPSVINFGAKVDGTLVAPNADAAKVSNLSNYTARVSSVQVENVGAWHVVHEADLATADTDNNVYFTFGPASGALDAADYLTKADVASPALWNMSYTGGDGDNVPVAYAGKYAKATVDISQDTPFAKVNLYVKPGNYEGQAEQPQVLPTLSFSNPTLTSFSADDGSGQAVATFSATDDVNNASTTFDMQTPAGQMSQQQDGNDVDIVEGTQVTVHANPDEGYELSDETTVTEATNGSATAGLLSTHSVGGAIERTLNKTASTVTFTMPAHPVDVNLVFEPVATQGGGSDPDPEPVDPAVTYTVTYDSNGGTGTMAADTVEQGGTYKAPECTFERPGYEFIGWKVGGAEVCIQPSGTVAITQDVTLYAQWTAVEPAATYSVTYIANGADVSGMPQNETGLAAGSHTLSSAAPTRTGYTFAGWGTAPDGPVSYAAGAEVVLSADLVLYAQWTPNTYTVTYMDGETTLQSGSAQYGAATPAYNGTPTKDATAQYTYAFKGWSTSSDAASAESVPTTVTGDATYYAVFSASVNSYVVAFKNGEETLQSGSVEYGQVPAYAGVTPTQYSTPQYEYSFDGWLKNNTGDVIVSIADVVTGAVDYYAHFAATNRIYEVTLDAQSGSGGTAKVYEKYAQGYYTDAAATEYEMTASANAVTPPTREGHDFAGYYTAQDGEGTQYIDANGYLTENASNTQFAAAGTLYASWTAQQASGGGYSYPTSGNLVAWSGTPSEQGDATNPSWDDIAYTIGQYHAGVDITKDSVMGSGKGWKVGDTISVALDIQAASYSRLDNGATTTDTAASYAAYAKTVEFEIVDIGNTSYKEGADVGSLEAAAAPKVVIQQKQVIPSCKMNGTATNVGGWRDSALRQYVTGEYLDALPDGLSRLLKTVAVGASVGNTSSDIAWIYDKLFLPAEYEVFGTTSSKSAEDATSCGLAPWSGKYDSADHRKKYSVGSSGADYWWLRSPYVDDAANFRTVNTYGNAGNFSAIRGYGLAPSGCI